MKKIFTNIVTLYVVKVSKCSTLTTSRGGLHLAPSYKKKKEKKINSYDTTINAIIPYHRYSKLVLFLF